MRRREISPVEITGHYLDRIARLDSQVGAYVTVTPELALELAHKAEARVLAGEDFSPLAGVPIPIKDLDAVRRLPRRLQRQRPARGRPPAALERRGSPDRREAGREVR